MGEIGRPVQGIKDPAEFRAAEAFQAFLGQKIVAGISGRKAVMKEGLRGQVRFGDQIDVAFEADLAHLEILGLEEGPGFQGRILGRLQESA